MMTDHAPSYQSIPPYSSRILVLGIRLDHVFFMMMSYVVSVMTLYHNIKQIPIIHTKFNILVLGLGLASYVASVMTMYSYHIISKHTSILITHIGIGSWLGPYIDSLMTIYHPMKSIHNAYHPY